jgi:curved DNA-binding protein CbpA
MKTPYRILDVVTDANDAEIKRAYLKKVKECPPDRDQEAFQLIHNAYISIKDIKSRMRYALFTLPTADFDGLIDHALETGRVSELKPELFNKLLRASIDESSFLNAIDSPEKL